MDGMHCFIDSISVLVKIKSVSLYNCQTVYIWVFERHCVNKQPTQSQELKQNIQLSISIVTEETLH